MPFAGTLEGGRTTNGDGASLLCTSAAEERSKSTLSEKRKRLDSKHTNLNATAQAGRLINGIYGRPWMPVGTQF
jgi:hypothetical protein